jgi:hypothetical protein
MDNKTNNQEKVKQFLKSLITARNFPTLWLSLTTIVVIYPSAHQWAETNFASTLTQNIVATFFTIVVWGALDGVLDLILRYLDSSEQVTSKNRVFFNWVCGIGFVALIGTGTLSYWAAPLMASLIQGDESEGTNKTKDIIASKLQLEIEEARAKSTAIQSGQKQYELNVELAYDKADQLEKEAAFKKGISENWISDYKAAKENPDHWFWVCSSCPYEYRQYRESIKKARRKGEDLIVKAQAVQIDVNTNRASSLDDATVGLLTKMATMDSIKTHRTELMTLTTTKVIIASEVISALSIIFLTLLVWHGKKAHDIKTLDIEFFTAFSFIELLIDKLLISSVKIIKALLESLDPVLIGSTLKLAIAGVTYKVQDKVSELSDRLEQEKEAKEAATKNLEAERQKTAQAEAQAAEARQKLLEQSRQNAARQKELEAAEKIRQMKDKQIETLAKIADSRRQEARQPKPATPTGSAKRRFVGKTKTENEFKISVVSDKIIINDKTKVSTYNFSEIADFCDLSAKWYSRQFTSKADKTRAKNAAKWEQAKGVFNHIGVTYKVKGDKVEISYKNIKA